MELLGGILNGLAGHVFMHVTTLLFGCFDHNLCISTVQNKTKIKTARNNLYIKKWNCTVKIFSVGKLTNWYIYCKIIPTVIHTIDYFDMHFCV